MEGDSCCRSDSLEQAISIHSLRMEGDKRFPILFDNLCISIHSLRMEGDGTLVAKKSTIAYFNPLPPHGGRPSSKTATCRHWKISIHSLRMEGDEISRIVIRSRRNFNPLPPHGRRLHSRFSMMFRRKFQSTPSAWRETMEMEILRSIDFDIFQSTPSAWRETITGFGKSFGRLFQSTPSAWRETILLSILSSHPHISIHSLRMEGDPDN